MMYRFFLIAILFVFCSSMNAQQLSAVEYFIDQDPGAGNAFQQPLTGLDSQSMTFNVNTINITNGLHNLFIRTINDSNVISLTNVLPFVKTNFLANHIQKAEFFFDLDPGLNNGQQILINAGDTSNFAFQINTNSLSQGLHNLFVRTIDTFGQASLTSQVLLVKIKDINKKVIKAQYFFDNDPMANNTPQIPLNSIDTSNFTFQINTTDLSQGLHNLFIRTVDDVGGVSLTNQSFFIKIKDLDETINYAEYFFDLDPGAGNGFSFPISGSNVQDQIIPIQLPSLAQGLHNLFIRTRDNYGNWSLTTAHTFIKVSQENCAFKAAEYYIDTDPGIGNGHVFAQGHTNPSNINLNLDITTLDLGAHELFIRTKDSCDHWSITHSINFFKIVINPALTKMEYFLDTDPGFGEGISVPLMGLDSGQIALQVNTSALDDGLHFFSSRTMSNTNAWSTTTTIPFIKYTTDNAEIVEGEYFFNQVAPHGSGTSFSLSSQDTNQHLLNLDLSSLPIGLNYLFLRTKDSAGKWSQLSSHIFVKHTESNANLVKFEYFFDDDDPGFGNAAAVNLTNQADLDSFHANIFIPTIGFGYHKLRMRSYSSDHKWSMVNSHDFAIYCQDSIVLIDVFVPDSMYHAAQFIKSNGIINPVNTTFKSSEIDLLPGFSVPLGITFSADIENCLSEAQDPNILDRTQIKNSKKRRKNIENRRLIKMKNLVESD